MCQQPVGRKGLTGDHCYGLFFSTGVFTDSLSTPCVAVKGFSQMTPITNSVFEQLRGHPGDTVAR